MKKLSSILLVIFITAGCNGADTSVPGTAAIQPPQQAQTVASNPSSGTVGDSKTANGNCSDPVMQSLAEQYVLADIQGANYPASDCKIKNLERIDPANTGDTWHFFAEFSCAVGYVPFYIFNVTQANSGVNGATTCSLISYDIPPPVAPTPRAPTSWSIDQFVTALEGNKFTTIEQALLSLPESARSSFTLLYGGHGLRGTSTVFPGVILYSNSGEYAITFGDESQALGNELEIFRFDSHKNKGELVRAAFPPENGSPRTGGITVEKNPTQCLTCHQSDPMMRWGSYSTWTGAFGGNDDTIDPNGTDAETQAFLSFMKSRTQLPRYRTLVLPVGETGIFPYWDNSPVSPYTALSKDGRMALRPNSNLNSAVAAVDGRRLARKIMESPEYKNNRAQLLYEMLNCDTNYSNFAPILTKLGIVQVDLEPNILAPLNPDQLPEYSNGFSSYGPGRNSVIDYAADFIYQDLLKDHPELSGNYAEQSEIDSLSSSYWVFGSYPLTVQIFTDAAKLGSYLSPNSDAAQKDFCSKLQQVINPPTVAPKPAI